MTQNSQCSTDVLFKTGSVASLGCARRYNYRLAWLLIGLTLAGCSSYGERVANACASMGVQQGTPNYWSCVQQQVDVDQRNREMWSGTTAVGARMLYRPAPIYS